MICFSYTWTSLRVCQLLYVLWIRSPFLLVSLKIIQKSNIKKNTFLGKFYLFHILQQLQPRDAGAPKGVSDTGWLSWGPSLTHKNLALSSLLRRNSVSLKHKSHEVSPQINSIVQESWSLKLKIHLYLQLVEPWGVHSLHLHIFLLGDEFHIFF